MIVSEMPEGSESGFRQKISHVSRLSRDYRSPPDVTAFLQVSCLGLSISIALDPHVYIQQRAAYTFYKSHFSLHNAWEGVCFC